LVTENGRDLTINGNVFENGKKYYNMLICFHTTKEPIKTAMDVFYIIKIT
jgi:hypothetical protein